MKSLGSIRDRLAKLAALPTLGRPIAFVFRHPDGTYPGDNFERLQAARAANAQIVEFRFMRSPSEDGASLLSETQP